MIQTNIRFRRIDETNRDQHAYYEDGDDWLFLYEKTSHRDYSFSDTNNLISNLKKPINSSQAELNYKNRAITASARALRHALQGTSWLDVGTMVPVPPSKAPNDPLYDNRMETVCRLVSEHADVRNLVVQNTSMVATHERGGGPRITRAELLASYEIDENLVEPEPTFIAIVDDMLTSGTHYRAMRDTLSRRFPGAHFVGFFIARRIFPDD